MWPGFTGTNKPVLRCVVFTDTPQILSVYLQIWYGLLKSVFPMTAFSLEYIDPLLVLA